MAPLVFEVGSSSGQLSIANYEAPTTRVDAYELSSENLKTKEELMEEASCIQSMRYQIYKYSIDHFPKYQMEDWLESDVEAFLDKLDEDQFKELRDRIVDWLNKPFYPVGDEETMPYNTEIRRPLSGSAAAYRLFYGYDYCDEFEPSEVIELLGIELVEGEYPGSSYYAAELSIPAEQANAIAEQNNVPIRFVPLKD